MKYDINQNDKLEFQEKERDFFIGRRMERQKAFLKNRNSLTGSYTASGYAERAEIINNARD